MARPIGARIRENFNRITGRGIGGTFSPNAQGEMVFHPDGPSRLQRIGNSLRDLKERAVGGVSRVWKNRFPPENTYVSMKTGERVEYPSWYNRAKKPLSQRAKKKFRKLGDKVKIGLEKARSSVMDKIVNVSEARRRRREEEEDSYFARPGTPFAAFRAEQERNRANNPVLRDPGRHNLLPGQHVVEDQNGRKYLRNNATAPSPAASDFSTAVPESAYDHFANDWTIADARARQNREAAQRRRMYEYYDIPDLPQ
jgi:hypothetical protein